eukprot:CAMPEP_0184312752 /NCGR_PEP_ID=MMETSP1049-20130417/53262_1 /TAXON_ID=77928 /ORGANISM="Proteomonas sulcata, Strain CCMP704" /LENGTH=43 /DNA_ID= /DNA_START= /DNA_END= /DNA_ORIENTATION=
MARPPASLPVHASPQFSSGTSSTGIDAMLTAALHEISNLLNTG